MTEYAGFELALWQLSHGLEWIAGVGSGRRARRALAIGSCVAYRGAHPCRRAGSGARALSLGAAATARLAIDTTVRFYWQCTVVFAVLATRIDDPDEAVVMKILGLLWKNLRSGVATLRYPRRPPVAAGFRGMVQLRSRRFVPAAPCADSAAPPAPSPFRRPASNSSGLTIPHNARSAADAWMDAKIMPLARTPIARPSIFRREA